MEKLKLLGETKEDLYTQLQTAKVLSGDIHMGRVVDKRAKMVLKKGKLCISTN